MGPVVTLCGAANLGISLMARLLEHKARRRELADQGESRPLRPFAGMTRIRFKGFGFAPSQSRSGTPLEQNRIWTRRRLLSTYGSATMAWRTIEPAPADIRSWPPAPSRLSVRRQGRPSVRSLASGETRRELGEAGHSVGCSGKASARLPEDGSGGLFVRRDNPVRVVMKGHHLLVGPREPPHGHEPVLGQIENSRDEPDR